MVITASGRRVLTDASSVVAAVVRPFFRAMQAIMNSKAHHRVVLEAPDGRSGPAITWRRRKNGPISMLLLPIRSYILR